MCWESIGLIIELTILQRMVRWLYVKVVFEPTTKKIRLQALAYSSEVDRAMRAKSILKDEKLDGIYRTDH